MARIKPASEGELRDVKGVGTVKLSRYGRVFRAAIANQNPPQGQ